MQTVLIATGGLALGIALAFAMLFGRNAYLRKRAQAKRAAPHAAQGKRRIEMTKLVIWVCLVNGIAWVWFSYYLAWKEKTQIAEGLSQVAVTEIVGVVLAYCIKSVVENLSKNNHWPDKPNENKTVPTALEDPPDVGL